MARRLEHQKSPLSGVFPLAIGQLCCVTNPRSPPLFVIQDASEPYIVFGVPNVETKFLHTLSV